MKTLQRSDAHLPSVHYTMVIVGGLRPHEHDPGAPRAGRANFPITGRIGSAERSHAGAGRLVLHHSHHDRRLSRHRQAREDHARVSQVAARCECVANKTSASVHAGSRTVDSFSSRAGHAHVETMRHGADGEWLARALRRIPEIRAEFWENVTVPGSDAELNQASRMRIVSPTTWSSRS